MEVFVVFVFPNPWKAEVFGAIIFWLEFIIEFPLIKDWILFTAHCVWIIKGPWTEGRGLVLVKILIKILIRVHKGASVIISKSVVAISSKNIALELSVLICESLVRLERSILILIGILIGKVQWLGLLVCSRETKAQFLCVSEVVVGSVLSIIRRKSGWRKILHSINKNYNYHLNMNKF
jgi:hypothetical protein